MADAGTSALVAVGGCDGSATPAPLGPLVEMLPHLPGDVWLPDATRQQVFSRLLEALRKPSDGRPYLLVVEDVHWADEATLDLLRHLARRIHGCRALVLVTFRPEDATAAPGLRILLGDTASASGTRRIDLHALSPEAVGLLVTDHAREHPAATTTDPGLLHRVTGGNAFFVTEALSAGMSQVPPTVRDAVLEGTSSVELALAYSNRTQLRMLSSDLAGTQEWGRRTLDLVERLPEGLRREEVRVHALNNLGTMETTAGDLDTGRALLVESLVSSRAADLHEHAARAYCNLASAAVVQRRHEEAQRYLDEGIEYCIDRDLDSWTLYLEGCLARLQLDRGETTAARDRGQSVLERGSLSAIDAIEPVLVLAHLYARAGDRRAPAQLARAADLAAGMGELQRVGPATAARCEAAWIDGDADVAFRLAREAWRSAEDADCPWNRGPSRPG